MLNNWKQKNKDITSKFLNSENYWQKSPSSMLLKKAVDSSLKKYAKNKKVLDAGAGRLAYKSIITKYAKSYVSSDFKKTHPDVDIIVDIEKLSKKVKSVDLVFCSQVLEHVPHPWIAIKEINKVLKKNGIAIITVPHLAYLHNLPYDFYRYTGLGLRSLAEYANLKVISIEPIGGLFSFFGYIRSSFLTPFFAIPIFGSILFEINKIISKLEIFLDQVLKTERLFPLNYILIAKKI